MGFKENLRGMPPVTKNIIIINVLVWAVCMIPNIGSVLEDKLGLHMIGAGSLTV